MQSKVKLHIVLCLMFALVACDNANRAQQDKSTAFTTVSGEAVKPNTPLAFPKDHGIHQQQGIEWWYITSNLTSEHGETFGVQWTLFRTLMPATIDSRWWDQNLYFAHFALQHNQQHVAFERFARFGQAKITAAPFRAEIDNWQLASEGTDFLPLTLRAKQDDYAINLQLANSPRVLHGIKGYSQKTPSGHASYYYSYPFLDVSGTLTFNGKVYKVSGNAWYDREWSASLLDKDNMGWDWFSMVDESRGHKQGLMVFCIRDQQQIYDYCSATEIVPDGSTTVYNSHEVKLSRLERVLLDGKAYPNKWQVELPDKAPIFIESITKDSRNQLTIPYWEGRVRVSGGFSGKGYAELTGY